jgi:hypothetical protein
VTAVTIAVAEVDVVCGAANRQTIIAVVNDIVLEQNVRALDVETYRMVLTNDLLPWALNGLTVTKVGDEVWLSDPGSGKTSNSRVGWGGLPWQQEIFEHITSE